MNVTKNPYFTSITHKENPYLDTITFKQNCGAVEIMMQSVLLMNYLCDFQSTYPYIVKFEDRLSPAYTESLKYVENNPQIFKYSKQEVERAINYSYTAASKLVQLLRDRKNLNENLFKYQLTLFNDAFYETVFNRSLNTLFFIDGVSEMAKSLRQLDIQ